MVARLALIAPLVIAGVARAPQSEQDLVARARGIHERVMTLDTHNDIGPSNFTRALSAPVPQHHRGFLIDDERFDELVRCPGARDVDANGQDAGGAALQVDHVL